MVKPELLPLSIELFAVNDPDNVGEFVFSLDK